MRLLLPALLALFAPLLSGFHTSDEPAPYEAIHLPLLSWSIPADSIKNPAVRVAALRLEGRLEKQCVEHADVWDDLERAVVERNAGLVDLGGRSLTLLDIAERRFARLSPDSSEAEELGHAMNELRARQTLEARHRQTTASLLGRTHSNRHRSYEWCHYDEHLLAWLQRRHLLLAQAVLRTVQALQEPDKVRFHLDLLFPLSPP